MKIYTLAFTWMHHGWKNKTSIRNRPKITIEKKHCSTLSYHMRITSREAKKLKSQPHLDKKRKSERVV